MVLFLNSKVCVCKSVYVLCGNLHASHESIDAGNVIQNLSIVSFAFASSLGVLALNVVRTAKILLANTLVEQTLNDALMVSQTALGAFVRNFFGFRIAASQKQINLVESTVRFRGNVHFFTCWLESNK